MHNSEIAQVFGRIADLMEIKGENRYKVLAYRRAAELIPTIPGRLDELDIKELIALPGIGQALAEKIQELNSTGRLAFLQTLEREVPPGLIELLSVPDVGPKKAALFWRHAGITTLSELEDAARADRLRALPGMGEKSEARILAGVQRMKSAHRRIPIQQSYPIAEYWLAVLKTCPSIQRVCAAGSLRRMRATIGNIDLVASTDSPREVMDFFLSQSGIREVLSRGESKSSIRLEVGLSLQLWLQPDERFGSLLQFVTGSKAHNVRLREFALRQGLSLSERGFVTQDLKEILCAQEEQVYQRLGMAFIPPELREDRAELKAALSGELPDVVGDGDLRADLHLDGCALNNRDDLEEMGRAAIRRNLECICFVIPYTEFNANRTKGRDALERLRNNIEYARKKLGGRITLLSGLMVGFSSQDEALASAERLPPADVTIADLNTSSDLTPDQMTGMVLAAIRHPLVNIISFGGINQPDAPPIPQLNWEGLFTNIRYSAKALEINSKHLGGGLEETNLNLAARLGVPVCLASQAAAREELSGLRFSAGFSRRAGLNREQIISTWPPQKILEWLYTRPISPQGGEI